MGKHVMQEWTADLPFMQQTVLISAVRGCDGMRKYHEAKPLMRWYRRCILLSAFDGRALTDPFETGGGSFTGPVAGEFITTAYQKQQAMDQAVDGFLVARDEVPLHFYSHTMHAFQILGYKYPGQETREFWHDVYMRMVNAFHLRPESEDDMDTRLGDDMDGWKAREDCAGGCSN
jgi:hypothetical protein